MSDTGDNSKLRESLSAVLDGEAGSFELRSVLAHIESEKLRETAKRYRLTGDVIRGHYHAAFARTDLTAGIRAGIATCSENDSGTDIRSGRDATSRHIPGRYAPGIRRFFPGSFVSAPGRFATAAVVTIAVVLGVNQFSSVTGQRAITGNVAMSTQTGKDELMFGGQPSFTQEYGARGLLAGSGAEQTSLTPQELSNAKKIADMHTAQRFRAYSMNHAEQTATGGMQGMLPFVRAVSLQLP